MFPVDENCIKLNEYLLVNNIGDILKKEFLNLYIFLEKFQDTTNSAKKIINKKLKINIYNNRQIK